MSNPLEAASQAFRAPQDPRSGYAEAMRAPIVAYVRAAVGCEQCDGTSVGRKVHTYTTEERLPCPAEHAVITVLGETVYGDPAKCEYVCYRWGEIEPGRWHPYCSYETNKTGESLHERCGWQPRWSLISGTGTP